MKIAEVCPRYKPYIGGIETCVEEISKRLVSMGHDVTVLSTDPSNKLPRTEVIDGVNVIRFHSFAPNDAYYFSIDLYNYMKWCVEYDIVHVHGYHAFPAYYAVSAKVPDFIFTPYYHGRGHTLLRNLLLKSYAFLGRRIFEKAEHVICNSEFEKQLVCRDFKCDDKVVVIPPGINKTEFENLESYRTEFRSSELFSKDFKMILYVGRLEEYKGIQYIIRALPYLPEYYLVVVGEGSFMKNLKNEALINGVPTRVIFLGNRDRKDLLKLYAIADVFIMLSTFESYGIAVAEALYAGRPCIIARGSALDEFIGESCIGVDLPIDGRNLAKLIKSARFNGLPKSIKTWDNVVDDIIKIYLD